MRELTLGLSSDVAGGALSSRLAASATATVYVLGLHPQVCEDDLYHFFSSRAGKIKDIRLVTDPRTNKCRGCAYVEFYLPESIPKAMTCSGQLIKGYPVQVQASQAEKNVAAQSAKEVIAAQSRMPMKLMVRGLSGVFKHFTRDDVYDIFREFGGVEKVEVFNDGSAVVEFRYALDAKDALACMEGFSVCGATLRVGYFTASLLETKQ